MPVTGVIRVQGEQPLSECRVVLQELTPSGEATITGRRRSDVERGTAPPVTIEYTETAAHEGRTNATGRFSIDATPAAGALLRLRVHLEDRQGGGSSARVVVVKDGAATAPVAFDLPAEPVEDAADLATLVIADEAAASQASATCYQWIMEANKLWRDAGFSGIDAVTLRFPSDEDGADPVHRASDATIRIPASYTSGAANSPARRFAILHEYGHHLTRTPVGSERIVASSGQHHPAAVRRANQDILGGGATGEIHVFRTAEEEVTTRGLTPEQVDRWCDAVEDQMQVDFKEAYAHFFAAVVMQSVTGYLPGGDTMDFEHLTIDASHSAAVSQEVIDRNLRDGWGDCPAAAYLWDLYDGNEDGADHLQLSFADIHAKLTPPIRFGVAEFHKRIKRDHGGDAVLDPIGDQNLVRWRFTREAVDNVRALHGTAAAGGGGSGG